MKHWQIYACFSLAGIFLSGCLIQDAPKEKKKALCIVADHLTKEDSSVINQFSFDHHVAVTIEILTADAIIKRVRSKRYNADMDIILTEDQELRDQLYALGAFKAVNNPALFSQLDRQFNNKHHYWLPVSHDPLILTSPKDTSGNCLTVDFTKWHGTDSMMPAIKLAKHKSDYALMLQKSHHLNWIDLSKPTIAAGSERIYALSEFVTLENSVDSTYSKRSNFCRSFLIDNKRFITRMYTISIYSHGRNHATAENFIRIYSGSTYAIANGRNQLPASKKVQANWYIRSLHIR